jgi:phosphoglycolate phosphatase (TIGR01487 family)
VKIKNNLFRGNNLIKALALDVDGTITDKRRRGCISAIETIHKVEDMGIPVIIVTGNIICFTKALSTFLATSGGLVAENGGVIQSNDVVTVLGNFEKCQNAYNHLKSEFNVEKVQNSALRVSEIAITRKIPVDIVKKTLRDFDVEVYDSKFAIHITDPSVNKGSSLIKVASNIGVKPEEILAIGDSENDIQFLSVAGIKVAVSNADEDLKNIADYISKKPHGDGVKEAAEKYIF